MKYILITHPAGQLGNRILQMANLISYARRQGAVLINPGFDLYEYAQYFPFLFAQQLCQYPAPTVMAKKPASHRLRILLLRLIQAMIRFKLVKVIFFHDQQITRGFGLLPLKWMRCLTLGTEDSCNLDDPEHPLTKDAANSAVVLMCGWEYRSVRHFDEDAREIRTLFTPFPAYFERADEIVKQARGDADVLVGVHIRLGDYRTHKGGRYFYDLDVYKEKMQQVMGLFAGKKVRFLVCSNEEIPASHFAGLDYSPGSGHIIEDMYSFAKCDYIIGPPSTYTGWASFYGEKPFCTLTDPGQIMTLKDFTVFRQQDFLRMDQLFK